MQPTFVHQKFCLNFVRVFLFMFESANFSLPYWSSPVWWQLLSEVARFGLGHLQQRQLLLGQDGKSVESRDKQRSDFHHKNFSSNQRFLSSGNWTIRLWQGSFLLWQLIRSWSAFLHRFSTYWYPAMLLYWL